MSEQTATRIGRVRAPELAGAGGWINTGGKLLKLADLRGKIVVLDFWTFCCVNCLHVLDELRPLEEQYSDVLVVIGVHSPKFAHEAEHSAVQAAVERYNITHPVLDDPGLDMWQQYAARAWPTLVVIDPEGYVVLTAAGEGHGDALGRLIKELVDEHGQKGTLKRGFGPAVESIDNNTALRFPAKVVELPTGTLLVSDAKNHRLVELDPESFDVVRHIGTGTRGLVDGLPDISQFSEPQGLAVLPESVAAEVGYDVVVADTVNHALRGLSLVDGLIRTVARAPEGILLSPWDVAWWQGKIVVAAAGTHQLWEFEPVTGKFAVFAGTTTEGLQDGPVADAWFAQPSGLAVDGNRLWIADAETSALRYIESGFVHTVIGQGLFDFGHRDGKAGDALLQHPLGIAVLPNRSVAILDTYNKAIRRYDRASEQVSTMATDISEPSDALVVGDDLVVVESAAHRLSRIPLTQLAAANQHIDGEGQHTHRPATPLNSGEVLLEIAFEPAPGQQLDDRDGPATRLHVSSSPPELLLEGTGVSTELQRSVVISPSIKDGVLHITAQAASCDKIGEHPACHLVRQDWGVPVTVEAGAPNRLSLALRGNAAS